MHPKIKQMVRLMQEKEKSCSRRRVHHMKNKKPEAWYLYILRCRDDTFYTGITKDLTRRIKMHNRGVASRYTRTRGPVTLLYQEPCAGRTAALVRECEVKALPRKKKLALINQKIGSQQGDNG